MFITATTSNGQAYYLNTAHIVRIWQIGADTHIEYGHKQPELIVKESARELLEAIGLCGRE